MRVRRSTARDLARWAALCALTGLLIPWAGCFGCPCGSGPSKMILTADPIDWPELDDATSITLAIILVEDVELSDFADEGDEPMVFEGELELVPGFSGGWTLPVDSEPFPFGGCPMYGDATFELIAEGATAAFEPVTAAVYADYGGVDVVQLWNGWEVEIRWGAWNA
jgi:hypothetical protein